MRCFPIIPIWIMTIISIGVLYFLIDRKNIKKSLIDIGIVLLLFLINLRVMYPSGNTLTLSNNLDVIFVVDNTISMDALDYNGTNTRLSGVRSDLKYIVNKLNGAKFSVITFNNTVKTLTPLTKDNNMTLEAIDIIVPIDEIYAKGSSLNAPIEAMENTLEESSKKKDRQRILFFISDGEITDESKLESFASLKKYVKNGAVLGYGTSDGGYMKQYNKYTDKESYIMDYSGLRYEKAVSKIDEDNLKTIAKDIGIDYIHMDKQSNLEKKLHEIERLISSDFESSNKSSYEDTYFILVFPLILLIIFKIRNIKGELL